VTINPFYDNTSLKYIVLPDTIVLIDTPESGYNAGIAGTGVNAVTLVMPGNDYTSISAIVSGTLNPNAVVYCHQGSAVDLFCQSKGYTVAYLAEDISFTAANGEVVLITGTDSLDPRHYRAIYFGYEEHRPDLGEGHYRPDSQIQNITVLDALVTYHEFAYNWQGWVPGSELRLGADGSITCAFGIEGNWRFTLNGSDYDGADAISTVLSTGDELHFYLVGEEPVTDKTALLSAISEALSLNETDYTTESWAVLTEVLSTAQAVAANESATQGEVDDAVAALEEAVNALVIRPTVGAPRSGDLNGDGFVDMSEALIIAQVVVGGGMSLTPEQFAAVDMDGDGKLTMADVMLIMRKAAE
jgi:hypothetical protein